MKLKDDVQQGKQTSHELTKQRKISQVVTLKETLNSLCVTAIRKRFEIKKLELSKDKRIQHF